MDSTALDFSFSTEGINRNALLTQAARELDVQPVHLGGDTSTSAPETPEGALVRALREDVAQFNGSPLFYPITDKDFIASNRSVPFRFQELTKDYEFYWLRLPLLLFPKRNWGFNRLEIRLDLNAKSAPPHAQPRAYQILPEKKFQNLFAANSRLEVGIDGNFEFSAKTSILGVDLGTAELSLGGGAKTNVEAGVGLVLGPFTYRLKKVILDHTSIGLQRVFWRIEGTEFFQEDDPQLIVIAQLPKQTRELQVIAIMQAYRYFNFASANLQEKIKKIPEALRNFFEQGAPIEDRASWDFGEQLRKEPNS